MALDTSYMSKAHTPVRNFTDFIGNGLPETPKLKAVVTAVKSVFKVQDVELQLYYVEGRVYCIEVFTDKRKAVMIARVYYLPTVNQIHIWDNMNNLMLASQKKKIVFTSIPETLRYVGAEDKFRNIISSI